MSKLFPLLLVLTISPGYHLWVAYAALLPATYLLVREASDWLRSQHGPVPVRLRSIAEIREARLHSLRRRY